ncbi:MAG TPA: hypothetical protein VLC51_01945, partial [Nitrospira sp.]|nr:hypothetical protein [Nitrospira sp.]
RRDWCKPSDGLDWIGRKVDSTVRGMTRLERPSSNYNPQTSASTPKVEWLLGEFGLADGRVL